MVNTLSNPGDMQNGKQAVVVETLLTPRFYTTNFEEAAQFDISLQEKELRAMLAEMQADYNRHHFVRDEEFEQSWAHVDPDTRKAFIDYLERSCISEFSGFLLFKELSRRLKQPQPLLAEIFHLMARDEARHAGFLNKAMSDFNLSLDLGHLTKARTYTFFPLSWILYTVYLSEKIGYWRYILIYRQLQRYPENRFYPLFRYFESWCQDENRHGDIFKALVRSQPRLWDNWRAKLWIRFFLLMVFATHTMTVQERAGFYQSLGLDPTEYDRQVISKTNETAANAFSVVLDVDNPQFYPLLQKCSSLNLRMSAISKSDQPNWLKHLQKLPLQGAIAFNLVRLYLMKPVDSQAEWATVR